MEDSGKKPSNSKFMNPWMLHFQKLGLELKCPLCLSLFNKPVLLPCNHLFCNYCVGDYTTAGSECAVCKTKYAQRDLRPLPFVENMVAIYSSLEATFCANLYQQPSDVRILEPCQALLNSTYKKSRELEMSGGGEARKPNQMQCSRMEVMGHPGYGVVEMDVNHVIQTTPDSAPLYETKGSDNDCSDQDSEHPLPAERLEKSSLKTVCTENGNSKHRMAKFRSDSSASETESLTRVLKRPKNQTCGDYHIQPSSPHHCMLVDSYSDQDLKSGKDPGALLPANPDNYLSTNICSFCQSPTISRATGPMLHYANGNPVTGDAAKQSDVIHVHRVCIDWAPQVYFVDEAVNNLKVEVARGAKLKCSKCGLKGAALGCYVKSCRKTYHVPCALDISACRWDHEDFLLLCPIHSHVRFPNEKSRSKKKTTQKHPASSHLESQQSNFLGASHNDDKKLVFCGSALSTEEKVLLINFASKIGATVTKFWTPNVTHVIAATDTHGACSRTLKVLMAILHGRWILKMDWIKACMEVMHPVEEEPFEVCLDNQGCHGGPRAGRLRALANEPKLFSGLKFYFSGDYMSTFKKDFEDLVAVGGGTVLGSKEELEAKRHEFEMAPSKLLIVYNLDSPQGCKLGEEVSILWQRLNDAEALAANTGYQVIGHTWILESIAACKLQPLVS